MRFRAIATLALVSGCLGMLAACGGSGETGSGSPTAEQGRWSTAAPLPTPRSEIAVAQTDDVMYVIGGYTPETKGSNSQAPTILPPTPGPS